MPNPTLDPNALPWSECVAMFSINPEAATVRDIERLASEHVALAAALRRLLRAFESDVEQVPHQTVRFCWNTNSAAVKQARAALRAAGMATEE